MKRYLPFLAILCYIALLTLPFAQNVSTTDYQINSISGFNWLLGTPILLGFILLFLLLALFLRGNYQKIMVVLLGLSLLCKYALPFISYNSQEDGSLLSFLLTTVQAHSIGYYLSAVFLFVLVVVVKSEKQNNQL